jgi:hypothetical protein
MNSSSIVGTVYPQFKRIWHTVSAKLKLKNELHHNAESLTPQLQEQS